MKIDDLLTTLNIEMMIDKNIKNMGIKGIADNSNDVEIGFVFVAIKGYQVDGHDYIADAIQKGATLVIGEQQIQDIDVPYIKVENSRKVLGIISKQFYNNPSKDKLMIGITGTNGKTTTSYLIKHIVEACGKTCGLIGTIQNMINGKPIPSFQTTPSALMVNKLLTESKDDVVIMEVSSHGLSQHRVEGIEFDIAVFTNLYHEHLDYHHSMEEYFQAKLLLFDHLKPNGKAVINTDNEWGNRLAELLRQRDIPTFSVGEAEKNEVQLKDFAVDLSILYAKEEGKSIEVVIPIPGIHNMYNTMMAYLSTRILPIPQETIREAIQSFTGVDGRFEKYKQGNSPTVIVDYAHTPDAIFHCIASAKTFGAKHIFHVFGFRGNRDTTKRPQMLSLTAKYSDQYFLTFDDLNSISENEMEKTLHELNRKFGNTNKGNIVPDWTLAIQKAIEMANEGDWVIITGKGHENYQQSFELQTPSDKETVQYILNQLAEEKITN
ncbi:UDP-N-acetylmuramoyl-L-alanyl-D-glutamate--2,6-diaminopimelate ligase [Ornithinibacillus californiensis]|uniref:UDP-N-acetylmuramoyl-L-alanyl-D-glutamate--2, 6-diaminopimelate ligase n=1 Tax=Ornithinibacillus californiensis TaxID=161536 RepID=UPI00064DDBC9|nr:UDP-N-acetylmuramoyl-L-alanyl-D-glutamate--2,6-diaminopimelate ligase [Ornithinibacillus californiensis]